MIPRKVFFPLVSLLVLVVAGTAGIAFSIKNRTEKMIMANKQPLELETWPVGRYLIDIPKGVKVKYAQGYRGAGADVEVFPCTLFKAKQLVKERVEELQGTEHLEGGTLLERYVESKTLPNTWILHRWNERTFKGDVLDIDAYHWKEISGPTKPFTEDAYLFTFQSWSHPNDPDMNKAQSELEDLFRRVRIRDNHKIPTEPGFCMENAFIPGDPPKGDHAESASINFSVPGHPDIFMRFATCVVNSAVSGGETLLQRCKRVNSDPILKGLTIKVIRARSRLVGPLPGGQEYLEMNKEKGLWNMQFQWEFSGAGDSWEEPSLSLEMTSSRAEGSTAPLSMKEEEALALWDAVVETIRLRPTTKTSATPANGASGTPPQGTDSSSKPATPGTGAASSKPRASLGTSVKSGEQCPQSGTWACAHTTNLSGAEHTFQEGETFPEAVMDTNRGLLGKLTGRPAEAVVATTWTLVAYADKA